MYFTDIFIRRPVFATVLSLILLLAGLRAFNALSVRLYPNIETNVITVTTGYAGASPRLIEGFITTPLEKALGTVQGIDYMTSSSNQGASVISIHFLLNYDLNTAVADVSNAVSSVRSQLPQGIDDPIIAKQDPNARPTIFLDFESSTLSAEAITDYLIRVVQPQIQTLSGVGQAAIFGERVYAMRLWLDPQRMAAHKVTARDVTNAISLNNVLATPGLLEAPYQELAVTANTDLTTEAQFNNLVIKNDNGYLTRLKDVGYAKLGSENDRVTFRTSGNNTAVVMGIIPQPIANPLAISQEVNKLFPSIKANLPHDIQVKLLYDYSKFIDASLKEVRKTIFEATLFVALVIFLFLGSLRAVIIPLVTIPLSLIGVCTIMLAFGYTINTLTLLAWVLAIGLVVDDSIVVVENIHRHIELGEKPLIAATNGTREIGFAVIAMSLTLASVYTPIGFLTDITGRLFREFAFTLAGSVIVSGFVALTLSPMMSSRLLHHEINKRGLVARIDELFTLFMEKYKKLLSLVLQNKKILVVIAGIIYLSCYILYATLPSELAPHEDQGYILGIVNGPTSANLQYTEKYSQRLASIYNSVPEMSSYGIINGYDGDVNSAISFMVLKPWNERKHTANQIIQTLFPEFWAIPGVQAFPINPSPLPGAGNTPVAFVIKTLGSYDELNTIVQKMISTAQKENPRLLNLNTDLKLDKPQIDISVDRSKANALGISMGDIGNALNIFLGQPTSGYFEMNGRSYEIIPELYPEYMQNPRQMGDLNVRTASGQLIPLSNVINITTTTAPQSLYHFQQLRAATIQASLAPGYSLGQALDYLEKLSRKEFTDKMSYDFSGESRQFVQSSGGMFITFVCAILFIFLILAAQFESFLDPLIVMTSVLLSISGALLTMHLTGGTLNIYTEIGLVTLIGLISKHGILIVEFANKLQEKGHDKTSAVIEAASLRLRPILMTTGSMLLGALPLMLSSGAGAVSRSQLGWTVFGGMAFGTPLTLLIVPTFYTILATRKKKPT